MPTQKTMPTQNTYKTLVAYFFTCMLVIFVAGCGGGGSEDQAGADPFTENFVDMAAISGAIVAVKVGEVAILDDSRSFAVSKQALNYSWSFSHKPQGSNAVLQGATSASPSFVADVRGVYMVQLVVSAEGVSSQRAITTVVVTSPGERRTGRFNHLGLSSNCVNCHNGVSRQVNGKLLFPKPANHIASSNACQTCHTPQGFNIIPFADHQEVFGNCSECHNGAIAIGKSEFHPATTVECNECHNTTSFLELAADGSFDHSNITRTCAACHNGKVAIGKTLTTNETIPDTNPPEFGTHPVTNVECGYCHTTVNFLNAYPDHTDPAVVGAGCDSCHAADGSGSATGQSVGHPVTNVNLDCDSCHSILSFKMPGGIFNHSLIDATVQSCDSCHTAGNSINATVATPTATHQNTTGDCGSCHNTESFIPAFGVDHTDPAVLAARCDSCHAADGSGSASGMLPTTPFYAHMPTNEDCKVCHTPGTFSTGTFGHTVPSFVGSCDSCHNNVIGVGKLPNHIPTTPDNQDCADCHDTISFADVTFSHVGIVDNCVSCHDGSISIGKSFNHLPTNQDCILCHSTAALFKPASNFTHTGITDKCETCHDGSSHNAAVGAIGKTTNHIPAQSECSACHNDTGSGGFVSSTFMSNVHLDIISGCEGCHNDRFSTTSGKLNGKPANHLPTGQDCDVCHTNDSFMAPTNFAHAGITGNCESCHDGKGSHVTAGALGKAQATNPHPATTADCGACHAIGNGFTDGTFDHTGIVNNCASCHGDNPTATPVGPKKNNGHIPTTQDCSVCHVTGTFVNAVFDHTGIVDGCASCHDGVTATGATNTLIHQSTTEDCSVCHNTTAFAGARFDHTGITNNCASCHDGATARGKTPPPNHVPTTGDCVDCHQTTGFIPGTFDHVGIVNNCRSCHDGKFAIGKSNSHVATNQDCGICHTTTSFIGAGFNHTGIVNNCVSCHDGSTAIGMDAKTNPAHIATSLDCSSCHTTATFKGGTWTHDSSSAGNCEQCHSTNGGARSKPNGHLSTSEQCDVCHSTNGWAPTSFSHDRDGNYPGDHRQALGCTDCHRGEIGGGINRDNYPNQDRYAPSCAGCHAGDFESEGDHNGGKNGTIEQNKNCGASGCHKVTSSGF